MGWLMFMKLFDHFFFGLGNLTPSTLSILAIMLPVGTDLPASHWLTSDFGTCNCLANCYWFHPFSFLAWAIATRNYCDMVGAMLWYMYPYINYLHHSLSWLFFYHLMHSCCNVMIFCSTLSPLQIVKPFL